MRTRIIRSSILIAALTVMVLSACGAQDQNQDQIAPPGLLTQPAVQATGGSAGELPPKDTELLRNCFCYTTCSSNGRGWTSTYFVDIATSSANCSSLAAGFCRAKARDYKYHNSVCTL